MEAKRKTKTVNILLAAHNDLKHRATDENTTIELLLLAAVEAFLGKKYEATDRKNRKG